MRKTVIERLRKVDLKLANRVNRNRIGSLIGRLYFQLANESTWTEVPITGFTDSGIGQETEKTGEQDSATGFSIRIDRDWWDVWKDTDVRYAVRVTGQANEELKAVDINSHVADDNETFVSAEFRFSFSVETFW